MVGLDALLLGMYVTEKKFRGPLVRNINICGRILTQFTGLLRTNTVAAKRNLLAERTGLGKSVSVSLHKHGPCNMKLYGQGIILNAVDFDSVQLSCNKI